MGSVVVKQRNIRNQNRRMAVFLVVIRFRCAIARLRWWQNYFLCAPTSSYRKIPTDVHNGPQPGITHKIKILRGPIVGVTLHLCRHTGEGRYLLCSDTMDPDLRRGDGCFWVVSNFYTGGFINVPCANNIYLLAQALSGLTASGSP